jgi:glycerate kinase
MKFVLIPDSFKGTLTSSQVCEIIESEIKKKFSAEIIKIPVADGGEGSVDAFLEAVGGEKIFVEVTGPYFEKMEAFYGLIDEGKCAVIEMAACSGLPLVEGRKNPSLTTTYGVGELILHAVNRGVEKIIIGLGGSCTNDGGTGCAAALGIRFFDENGESFVPVGGTLNKINKILNSLRCAISIILFTENKEQLIFSAHKKVRIPLWSSFLTRISKHWQK